MISLKISVTDLPQDGCIKTQITPMTIENTTDKELSYIAAVMTIINDMINDQEGQEYLMTHYGPATAERFVELKALASLAASIGLTDFSNFKEQIPDALKAMLGGTDEPPISDKPVI